MKLFRCIDRRQNQKSVASRLQRHPAGRMRRCGTAESGSGICPTRSSSRRGALFHYYMVYLLMTGTIMASAGLCLHVVFQSGHRDEMQRWQLQTVNRLERVLREDVAASDQVTLTEDGALTCRRSGAGDDAAAETLWRPRGRDIHRVVQSGGRTLQQDRFRFSVGTVITMERGAGAELVIQIASLAMGLRSEQSAEDSQLPEDNTGQPKAEEMESASAPNDQSSLIRDRLIQLVVFQKPADSASTGIPQTPTGDGP